MILLLIGNKWHELLEKSSMLAERYCKSKGDTEMEIRAFLHPAGSKQAPRSSEYELSMSGVHKVEVVNNAKLINEKFLQVIDESKPVFAIVYSINNDKIWKFDSHIAGSPKVRGMIEAEPVLSTSLGAMLVQKDTRYPAVCFSIRIGEEEYFAGDTSKLSGKIHLISLKDLLDFVSGEITWGNLKGRSYLHERELQKEVSCQEANARLGEDLSRLKEELAEKTRECELLNTEVDKAVKRLEKIPALIKKFFS